MTLSVGRIFWGAKSTMFLWVALSVFSCDLLKSSRFYEAYGVVEDVRREMGQVVITHEDIPGLMPAMTMNFDVVDADVLNELKLGQMIRFGIEFTGKSYRVVSVEPLWDTEGPHRLRLEALVAQMTSAPEFSLIDQDGNSLSSSDLQGKIILLDFIYTNCPGPCPILTGVGVDVQTALKDFADRVWFVSITVDPDRDTPEVLRNYALSRGVRFDNWSFLTGDVSSVSQVAKHYGVGSALSLDGEVDHTIARFLIGVEGKIVKSYSGLEHSAEDLSGDLIELISHSSS